MPFKPGQSGNPKGGKKGHKGAGGRPPKALTALKQLAIKEAHGEAEKSLQFMVELRDDTTQKMDLRKAAADSIMDRVWGKPKQQVESSSFAEIIEMMRKKFA